jgi:deoxyribonuclease V
MKRTLCRVWPATRDQLIERQAELACEAAAATPGRPADAGRLTVAAAFCAFPTACPGPGASGDPVWVAAVLWRPASGRDGQVVAQSVVSGVAGAPYEAGLLGLRAGPLIERALRSLWEEEAGGAEAGTAGAGEAEPARASDPRPGPAGPAGWPPDVLLLDATGLDHPRGAGLALHLGAALGLPSVGATNRALVAEVVEPADVAGAVAPLLVGERRVGFALRVRAGANPLLVHAAWRTDPETALAVVRPLVGPWRTPQPLRLARRVARVARARAEGRAPD